MLGQSHGFIYILYPLFPQTPSGMINSHSFSSRAYFFDNPRRYDSDDDLSRNTTSRGERRRCVQSNFIFSMIGVLKLLIVKSYEVIKGMVHPKVIYTVREPLAPENPSCFYFFRPFTEFLSKHGCSEMLQFTECH